ncbi:MAG: alpha/beta hydrolase [Actinomycetota bacterium]|nr:alpha/beta hydrolase [Actinomycetota bacterium]
MPYIAIEGTRLHYRSAGQGPLALLIHGFPMDSTLWLDQLEGLASLRRCVAPDLRGFGASDPTSATVLTMERHADDLAALVAELDDGDGRADVVVLSMGGYVTFALCERHPEVVRSLALISTRTEADDEQGRARRDEAIESVVAEGRGAFADGMLGTLLAADADVTPRARLRTMIEGTRVETIVAAQRGMRERPDRTHVVEQLKQPIVAISGSEDSLTGPDTMRPLAERVGARLEVVDGAAHLPPIERPQAVNDVLAAFWS